MEKGEKKQLVLVKYKTKDYRSILDVFHNFD